MKAMSELELIEFFSKRPEIIERFIFPGSFRDYSGEIGKALKPKKEVSPLIKNILEESNRILNNEICLEPLQNQLLNYPLISYADHHGLLNYNLLYNSNLLYSQIIQALRLPFVVVFASGNIPMVNISHPRGFYFKKQKFNFFGEKQSKLPVFLFEKKIYPEKANGIDSFIISYDKDALTNEEKKFLEFLFFDSLEVKQAVINYNTFSDQISFLNFKLWKYYFDLEMRNSIPEIVYLQSNKIILDTLVEEINKQGSLVSMILFNKRVRDIFLNNFYGIKCCWGENMGSQFFWGVIERRNKKRLISLYYDDTSNSLIGEDFRLVLEKDNIIEALLTKKILQTSFFDLLITTFLEGFLALGGLNQVEYLPKMQKAHIKSLIEIGMIEEAAKLAEPVANGLICGMMPFDFDSGIDLIWQYNSTNGKFNGNLDRGLTQEDLDRVNNTLVTELISSGIDKTLGIG